MVSYTLNRATEYWSHATRSVQSSAGVVAAQHRLAAEAGASMLARGGNAVDAAVACAFSLGVVEPWMSGIGGSGYAVIWDAQASKASVIDFQGVLPAAIDRADYPLDPQVPMSIMGFPGVVNNRNVHGYGAVSIPGALKGLGRAQTRFGQLGLDTVLEPAIALAECGLPCNWFTTLQVALAAEGLGQDLAAKEIYLPGGFPPLPEQFLDLGKLSQTLRTVAEHGPDVMYGGALGESMCADLAQGGSRITIEDLANYEVIESDALTGTHRGVGLHTAGVTSGGPRLIEAFEHVATHLDQSRGIGAHSYRVYADALNAAWRSHKQKIGRETEVGGCTSHLSAVDSDGNMVAITYTLLDRFGAQVVLPGSGILMNNAVSYFDPRPGFPTSMSPGKRINASNMCPTIATRDGESLFAVGASGANFIMPCTMQVAGFMLDFDLTLEQAMDQPRVDASDRGSVRVDPRVGEDVLKELAQHFELEVAQAMVFPKLYSCPTGVSRDPATGTVWGANDPTQPVGGAAAP